MFTTDITLTDSLAADIVYSQVSLVDKKSIRIDATADLGEPNALTISHQTTGKGMTAKDRHLVRLDWTREDTGTDEIDTVSSSAYIVIDHPRRIITEADILSMVSSLCTFVSTSANLTKILHGEP